MINKICENCGNEDILYDADAVWNLTLQCMELNNVFNHNYCGECQTARTSIDVKINPIQQKIEHVLMGYVPLSKLKEASQAVRKFAQERAESVEGMFNPDEQDDFFALRIDKI